MPSYDSIIRNGTVVDGSGQIAPYKADLGIRNGKIAAIGGVRGDAKREIDATGCIVAPGFVEIHGHYDAQLRWDPYCTPVGWHGVTTVSIGVCGFGWAPCRAEDHDAVTRLLCRVMAMPPESLDKWLRWEWETFPEYLDTIDRQGLGVNVASMVPITPLRTYVMGVEEARSRSEMKPEELDRMKTLFREAMDAGAWGISFHKNPEDHAEDGGWIPSHVSGDAEALALAEVIGEYGIGSVCWTAGGRPGEKELLRELCRRSGRPMNWGGVVQHKVDALDPWREELAWSEENLELGLPLYAQAAVPTDLRFRLANFNLFDSTPAWVEPMIGSAEERIAKLKAPGVREKMKQEIDKGIGSFHGEWDRVFVAEAAEERNRKYEGKSVTEIAQATGAHPVDAFLDLAIDEGLQTEFDVPGFNTSNDEATAAIFKAPSTCPALSDGGAHYAFTTLAHWPTYVLADWTRDKGVLTLQEAHYKLSALPAWIMGYRDRGLLREGMVADINVYELEELSYSGLILQDDTPEGDPRMVRKSEGYRYTLVNGEVTFEDGKCTGALPGSLLRSTNYTV